MKRSQLFSDLGTAFFCLFGSRVLSAIVYGSAVSDDFTKASDVDCLVFLRNPTVHDLHALKNLRQQYRARSVKLDINVHAATNSPSARPNAFWHHNRSLFCEIDMQTAGKVVAGNNIFTHLLFDINDLRLEAVRGINALLYETRKLIVNKRFTQTEKTTVIKWCLYAVNYALGARKIFVGSKKKSVLLFEREYPEIMSPKLFFTFKRLQARGFTRAHLHLAHDFLSELDRIIYAEYIGSGTSAHRAAASKAHA